MDQLISQTNDIIEGLVTDLRDGVGNEESVDNLHSVLANQVPYIVGTYKAQQWLGDEAFKAIGLIAEWEQDNLGEVTTDFSDAEKVANLTYYMIAEELLNKSAAYSSLWDKQNDVNGPTVVWLEQANLNQIADELEALKA